MKSNTICRFTALGTALALTAALAGCGATGTVGATGENAASSESSAATASSAATTDTATGENAYAYLANFSYSDAFDDKGYLKGIKALDYVTLPENYTSLTLPAGTDKLTDTAVSDYINEEILANYKTTNQVKDRASIEGDNVNIDFVGSIDGTEFDGGNTQGQGTDITLGSSGYIAGFDDQIIGHTPGETFDVNVTFPEDYGNADLAGKPAVFATTLNYISEEITPELTDDWVAENLGANIDVKTVEDLNAYVNKNLLFSQESNAVYKALSEGTTMAETLPTALTDYLKDYTLYNIYNSATQYGVDLNTLLSAGGYENADAFLTSMQTSIDSMGKQMLIAQAVAEAQKIVCDDKALSESFKTYFGSSDSSSLTEYYGANYVKMMLLNNISLQNLLDTATITAQ